MANIAINVAENGTTTLATAGKYCDRNIDVVVEVAGAGGGGAEIEPIVLTGDCASSCAGKIAGKFIELYGDKVSTNEITDANNMFYYSTLERIPFALNFKVDTIVKMEGLFEESAILEVPVINNAYPEYLNELFYKCRYLRYLPEDLGTNWNWNRAHTYRYAYMNQIFSHCFSLRKIPEYFLGNLWGISTSSSGIAYGNMFYYCYALDEVNNIPIQQATLNSNTFGSTFPACNRLKNITFTTNEDGTAKTANWKSQTIDLSSNLGWAGSENLILNYNSGITIDKKVTDDATYQALKNDEDWYTLKPEYSRYNHDSAVNTINSLPDTSAYGTNTIKFKGAAGANTDGGAINTLTEEEIAVAAAKGWTVTLS